MTTSPDLALFTGTPAFAHQVMVGRPNVPDKERVLARIGDALDRVWLTNGGPLVQEFEREVAAQVGVQNCIATANATVGIELLVRTLALSGRVIVPSWTFVADAHALTWTGVEPAFADVDPMTHCLDPARVEAAITEDTTAIMGVHLWGRGCDVDALDDIARRHDLDLIFDAAHAFACSIDGKAIGGFGRAEVFSFHATKLVNSFEGGAITTDDDELAHALRRARNFGFVSEDRVVSVGTNAKMNEACAAMGLSSLEMLPEVLHRNRTNHEIYRARLDAVPGVEINAIDCDRHSNRHYVVVEVDPIAAGLSRDDIVHVLRLENIEARRYFSPGCHRHEPYRTTHPHAGRDLPVTEALSGRVLVLPTGLNVEPEMADRICSLIATAVARAPQVRAELPHIDPERLLEFWR